MNDLIFLMIGLTLGFIGGWRWHKLYVEFKSIMREIDPNYHWTDRLDLYFAIAEKRREEQKLK